MTSRVFFNLGGLSENRWLGGLEVRKTSEVKENLGGYAGCRG